MYDYIIVGAGLSGSMLGYLLKKNGYNVIILEKQQLNLLNFGSCVYDIERQELTKNGEFVVLTPVETELMRLLVKQLGVEVSRSELARLTKTENERTIDVQVNRLRKKIEEDSKRPRYLQTVRGKGYLLLPD